NSVVLACSALKLAYSARLAEVDDEFVVVHLRVPATILAKRLRGRTGHFAGPDLLAGQFRDLEPPPDAVVVDALAPVSGIVTSIRQQLGL
ncbi:MAG: gluconokinase, partial [Longimicrobiales bacterium]